MKQLSSVLIALCLFKAKVQSAPASFGVAPNFVRNTPDRDHRMIVLLKPEYSPQAVPMAQNRLFFNAVGNWIESSDWFPIELNVPDTISGIGQGITNFGSMFQGLPIVNRISSHFTKPKPERYYFLAPSSLTRKNAVNIFEPFEDPSAGVFLNYP